MSRFEIRSIIIMKLDHIGDMVLTTPVFRAIKNRFPECSLGVLCSSKGELVLKHNPLIDDIFIYNPDMFDRSGENNTFTKMLDFNSVLAVRSKCYDVCISLREDHNNAVIQKMLGARYNISFSSDSPYSEVFDYSLSNPGEMQVAHKNFELLRLIDIVKPYTIKTEIYITKEDDAWVDDFLKKEGIEESDIIVGISPGGGWFLNWWPWENYLKVCEALINDNKNIKIILVGGKAEKKVIYDIISTCKYKLIDAGGKTTLQQLSALYRRMSLIICNDGGPMHIASTADVPIIALFGPSPVWFYPVGDEHVIINKKFACSPCPQFEEGKKPKCLDNKCMKAIEPREVITNAINILRDVHMN